MSKFILRELPSGIKFDLTAANGQRILTSEIYTSRAAACKGMASVRLIAAQAGVENQTEGDHISLAHPKFEMYRDKAGAYRFRLKARNGKIVGVSEGYSSKTACLNGIDSVKTNAPEADIEE